MSALAGILIGELMPGTMIGTLTTTSARASVVPEMWTLEPELRKSSLSAFWPSACALGASPVRL
jgi:hypothetical protein